VGLPHGDTSGWAYPCAAARQAQLRTAGRELAHNPDAGERLRKSVQCTEEPMSDFIARSWYAYSSLLPTHFKIVCLFGLLGLALAAAVIPTIAPENLSWVLSHANNVASMTGLRTAKALF
jgi:hypothetical protein